MKCLCGRQSKIFDDVNIPLPESQTGWGATILHIAARGNCIDCVRSLVEKRKASCDVRDLTYGNTPLHDAVRNGYGNIVRQLLAYKASVNIENIYGWTPLTTFIRYHNEFARNTTLTDLKTTYGGGGVVKPTQAQTMPCTRDDEFRHAKHQEIGEMLIDNGAGVTHGKIPHWLYVIAKRREMCEEVCALLVGIRCKRNSILNTNVRDVILMIARMIWSTRFADIWQNDQ